jgi:signal transduction histidine kinase
VNPFHFLSGLVNGMRCGVLAVDRLGRLMMINRVALQVLGLRRSPAPGAPIARALASYPQLARVMCESFDMSSLPSRAEMELKLATADSKTIGFTMSMVPGPEGQPIGAALFFKDLAQIEHKAEQERLKDRLAALGEMAANMAHEIRNPLASIDVSCSLLRRRLQAPSPDEWSLELLDKITAEVRRLNGAITSSLEYVRPLSLSLGHAELAPLLEEAITVATRRGGAGGGPREVRCSVSQMPAFLMDREKLRQVFENLVLNALEAIGEQGLVTVEAELRDAPSAGTVPYPVADESIHDPWRNYEQFAVVRVADTGPGIGEKERSRIGRRQAEV